MIVRISRNYLLRSLQSSSTSVSMLFSQKKPTGFDKFKRTKSSNQSKNDQSAQKNEKQESKEPEQNSFKPTIKNHQEQIKGFGRFARKIEKQQKKIDQQKREEKQESQQHFIKQDPLEEATEKKEQQAPPSTTDNLKGFQNFIKTPKKISPNISQKKAEEPLEQNKESFENKEATKTPRKQQTSTFAKMNNSEIPEGFRKFDRSKKVKSQSNNNKAAKVQQPTQEQEKMFQQFKKVKQDQSQQKKQSQKSTLNSSQQQKPDAKTPFKQKQKQLNTQQLKEKLEKMFQEQNSSQESLKEKGFGNFFQKDKKEQKQKISEEDFFMQKIDEFKKEKKKKIEQDQTLHGYFKQLREEFYRKIEAKTGLNFRTAIDPPDFIKKSPTLMSFYLIFAKLKFFIILGLVFYLYGSAEQKPEEIESDEALKMIDSGEVNLITFFINYTDNQAQFGKKQRKFGILTTKQHKKYQFVNNPELERLIKDKVQAINIAGGFPIMILHQKINDWNIGDTFRSMLTLYLLYIMIRSIGAASRGAAKGGRAGSSQDMNIFGNAKSRRFQQAVNVKFEHVVGMQKAKDEIVQFIDFLKNPAKYERLGARIPKGALLTGPPGTGKTMIAKACAGESQVPFFTISGSQFMEMYVGVGAQRVRQLFKEAKDNSPSIIFIDEIDAVGKKRASGFGGGNDERDNTLNQLLVEMDGFGSKTNVIVFAATNQKEVLDPALTRPGRFDRLIEVDLPDIQGRKEIFKIHLRPIVIDTESSIDEYARRMATLTPGFSGADIRNLCNEAAIIAARENHSFVTLHDFEMATQRVIGGVEKKSSLITPETQKVVAYHECGHGVCSWFMEGANPLLKLTIIPRSKGALGFAQYLPYQSQISTRKQLQDQICVILGGRISEEIFFKKISTGAYDDLQKAYQLAKMIVSQYGMSDKLGWLRYEETEYTKLYSKKTEQQIDEQILQILRRCTERTRVVIHEKRQLIEKLAQRLLEKETIDQTIITEILGERPYKPNKQYEQYLKEKKKMSEELLQTKKSDLLL